MLLVDVITRDIRDGEVTVKRIDHNDRWDRQWLGKHAYWAMRNGHEVTTRPVPPEVE